jgi:hypothetical protein
VSPNGDVYVAWVYDDGFGQATILIRRSTDGGNNFDDAVPITVLPSGVCFIGVARPQTRPSLTVSPNEHLFMVTSARRSSTDREPIIRLYRSENNGASWSETWSRDSGNNKQNFFPSVVVTPNEKVHITFTHSTAELQQDQCAEWGIASTWMATSDDDGFNFPHQKQVSVDYTIPTTPTGIPFYFDANAAAGFTDDAVFTVWTDFRNLPDPPVPYSASMLTSTLPVPNNWTLSSIPHFMDDYHKANVYPLPIDPNQIFTFTPSGYQNAPDPLPENVGFWVRFHGGNQRFLGTWKDEMAMPVTTGWNIIGSISSSVSTEDVIQNPPNIVVPWYFGYDPVEGYVIVNVLEPGKGYWVKVNQNGTLTLPYIYNYTGPPLNKMENNYQFADEFVFLDSVGYRQRLHVGSEGERIEMPPDVPNGVGINVRFLSGNFQEIVRSEDGLVSIPISLHRVQYPITLRWRTNLENGILYWIRDGNIRLPLDSVGSITIPRGTDGIVRLEALTVGANKPTSNLTLIRFSFKGSFPNPFNPSTQLAFELPQPSHVSLVVYDILGRRVATLVDEKKSAGNHSVVWQGKNDLGHAVATGVYFVKFLAFDEVGNVYTKVDKLLLTK